jgi:cysteine desulfurase
MKTHYFDHVATNPLRDDVFEAMLPYFKEKFGNPLSTYPMGAEAREAMEEARSEVAALINGKPSGIVFTASGAEANNFALRGAALSKQEKGRHVIVSKVEHHSVLNSARFLEKQGFTATFLPIDGHGRVSPETLQKMMTDETVLVSIVHASSEVAPYSPSGSLRRWPGNGEPCFIPMPWHPPATSPWMWRNSVWIF